MRKLNPAGDVLWTRRIGTSRVDDSLGVALDADGAYITGVTCGALGGHVPAGRCDAFVAKLSPDGDLLWTSQFGTTALDIPYQYGAIAVHSTGVYVAGKTYGTFPGAPPVEAPNSFLARLDAGTGDVLWVRQFGAPDYNVFTAGGVAVDDTGIAVGANSSDSTGAWTGEVRKYDVDGTVQWSRVFDQADAPCGHPIFNVAAHRGHVYTIGQTYEWALTSCEPEPYGRSYVVGVLQKLDGSGNIVWRRRIKADRPVAKAAPASPRSAARKSSTQPTPAYSSARTSGN